MNKNYEEWERCKLGLYLELESSIVKDVIRVVENYKDQSVLNALHTSDAIKPVPPSPSPTTPAGGRAMSKALEALYENGWSHDKLAVLLATSRPRVKAILDGDKKLKLLEARLVESVASKCPSYKEFNKRAIQREILRFVREEL